MKKNLMIFSAFALLTALTVSCKKDRTCTCSSTYSGIITGTFTADTTFMDVSKKDADSKCSSLQSSGSVLGQTWETTCELN